MPVPSPLIRTSLALVASTFLWSASAGAQPAPPQPARCPATHDQLAEALKKSVKASGGPTNGGLDNNEWASIITRDGTVCAVAYSGQNWDDQWPGSRRISAEKANTANAFSVRQKAIATANLYAGAQPGGYLFGMALSNPVVPQAGDEGDANAFGSGSDPMVGKRVGGVVVFGGGLALYDDRGIVGALGVSGDTSCADHNVAWRVRHLLGLDHVPAGVTPNAKDAIVYDIGPDGKSASGFGHPKCNGKEPQIATDLGAGVDANATH